MNSFHLHTIHLADPVTIHLPSNPRPRIVSGGESEPILEGEATTLAALDCAFWVNLATRQIHAQIALIPNPLLLYSDADFAAVAADLPEHHAARVMQILGEDPAPALQALCSGVTLPPAPPRVPREIPNWRAKAVLATMGRLADVDAAIAALPDPDRTIVSLAWGGDAKLARHGKTVLGLAAALGLSAAEVDALFIAAEAIEV